MPIWWRRARFSSSRAARERKIEDRVARAVLRKMSIGGENYERSIIPLRSETSRFSRGTGAANAVNWSSSHFSDRTLGASRHAPFEVTLRRRVSAPVRGNPLLSPGWVLFHHSHNQLSDICPQPWPSHPRFPSPEELESFSVPSDQSLRFDDH